MCLQSQQAQLIETKRSQIDENETKKLKNKQIYLSEFSLKSAVLQNNLLITWH